MKHECPGYFKEDSLREDLLFYNMIMEPLIARDLPHIGLCAVLPVAECVLMIEHLRMSRCTTC